MKHQTTLLLILFSVLIISNANAQTEYSERKLSFTVANNYFQPFHTTNNLNNVINSLVSYNFQFGLYYNLISETNYSLKTGIKWQPLYIRFEAHIQPNEIPFGNELITSGRTEDWFGDVISVPVLFEKRIELNKFFDFTLTTGLNFHLVVTNQKISSPEQYVDTTMFAITREYEFTPFLTTNYEKNQYEFSTGLVVGFGVLAKTLKGNYRLNLIGNLNLWNLRNVEYQFDNLATINHSGTFNLKGNYLGVELVITPKKEKKD